MKELFQKITHKVIRNMYEANSYKFYDQKPYDCNFFGIRNANPDQTADEFNDFLGVAYKDEFGNYCLKIAFGTTDPSRLALTNPSFPEAQKNGTAILCEGYYPSVYQYGTHGTGAWQHAALRQKGTFRIYRDANRDNILDFDAPITEGIYGINRHAAHHNFDVQNIGRYGEGCQVTQNYKAHLEQMAIAKRQILMGIPNSFSYALFNQRWLEYVLES